MPNKMAFVDYEPQSIKDIFSAINVRQITALMLHSEMADLFEFLGLEGFRAMHEYQFLEESSAHRSIKTHYLKNTNKLLPDAEVDSVDVIPDDWVQYTRMDVTPQVRKQAVQRAMEQYHKWESDTKMLYCKSAAYLIKENRMSDYNKVNELVKDVTDELRRVERLYLELSAVNYDMVYVVELQDELCKEYCKPVYIKDVK